MGLVSLKEWPAVSTSRPSAAALGNSPVAQLCFVTADLESAVAAFAAVSGLTPGPIAIAANAETPTTYEGKAGVARARTCAFRMPNVDIEFLEPGPEPSVWRDTLDRLGPALHHIAFRSGNLAEAEQSLGDQGLVSRQAADFVDGGGKYAVFDTSRSIGAMIELFELRSRR